MNREHKCEEILKRIIKIVNKDDNNRIIFASDIGKDRGCLLYEVGNDKSHYHIEGNVETNFNMFVNDLYKFLVKDERWLF